MSNALRELLRPPSHSALCASVSNPVQDEGASMTSQVTDVLEAVQSFIAKGQTANTASRTAISSISN
jgi:hypothetical protein